MGGIEVCGDESVPSGDGGISRRVALVQCKSACDERRRRKADLRHGFLGEGGRAERSIEEQQRELRKCTYAGRPFGEEAFVAEMEDRFQGNGGGPAREESGGIWQFRHKI